jgi:hypothetical protein
MDLQTSGHPVIATILAVICLISGLFASIVANIELFVRLGAGAIAMVSGFFAIRYYYYATRKVIRESQNQ